MYSEKHISRSRSTFDAQLFSRKGMSFGCKITYPKTIECLSPKFQNATFKKYRGSGTTNLFWKEKKARFLSRRPNFLQDYPKLSFGGVNNGRPLLEIYFWKVSLIDGYENTSSSWMLHCYFNVVEGHRTVNL